MFLVPKEIEDGEDEKWPKVLNVEDIVPTDLFAEVLEGEFVVGRKVWFEGSLVVGEDGLFVVGFVGELLLMIGDFG